MRQAGVLAAAALVALENAQTTLTDDHLKAKRLGQGKRKMKAACDYSPNPSS